VGESGGVTERIYVSGVDVASRPQTGTIAVRDQPLRIGGNNAFAGKFFNGLIDEVGICNRARAASEIAAAAGVTATP
jgi:hypothetical protein